MLGERRRSPFEIAGFLIAALPAGDEFAQGLEHALVLPADGGSAEGVEELLALLRLARVSPRIAASISSARAAARGPSSRSNFPPVRPSSYWKPRTIRAKKPSMVPSVKFGSARTTRSSDSAKSASGSSSASREARRLMFRSPAAAASLVRTESANSPAALRVKVERDDSFRLGSAGDEADDAVSELEGFSRSRRSQNQQVFGQYFHFAGILNRSGATRNSQMRKFPRRVRIYLSRG